MVEDPSGAARIEVAVGRGAGSAAGRDAARACLAGLRVHPASVLLVHASVQHELPGVLAGVREVFPDPVLIGASTCGEIDGGIHRGSVVITALASPHLRCSVGVGDGAAANWREALDQALAAPELRAALDPDEELVRARAERGSQLFALLLVPGNTRRHPSTGYEIVEAFKLRTLGSVALIAGASADDWNMQGNAVFHGGSVHADGLLVAVFETELSFGIGMSHGFQPSPQALAVTGSTGRELLSLDGEPALPALARRLGRPAQGLRGQHITLSTRTVLGTRDPLEQYSINVASYATERDGVLLTQPVAPGAPLYLMSPSEATREAGSQALRKALLRAATSKPALVLVHDCAIRSSILGEQEAAAEIAHMARLAPQAALAGFCSFGEGGVADDGVSRYNNASVSVLVLGRELSRSASAALENRRLREELHALSELRLFDQALRQTRDAFAIAGPDLRYRFVNPAFTRLFEYSAEEIVGQGPEALQPPQGDPGRSADALVREAVAADSFHGEVLRRSRSGRVFPVLISLNVLRDAHGDVRGFVCSYTDLSERYEAERAAREAADRLALVNARLATAISASDLSLWDYDAEHALLRLEESATRLPAQLLEPGGVAVADLELAVHPHDLGRVRRLAAQALEGGEAGFHAEFRIRDGEQAWRWLRCAGRVVERQADGSAKRAVGTALDITESKRTEERLRHAALHDSLTGLPNRLALTQHLNSAIARTTRHGRSLAVGMMDLNDFKPVNDTWGHVAGDRLLVEVARRLSGLLRAQDFLARMGGDEFVVVIEELDPLRPLDSVAAALKRLHGAVERPFEIDSVPPVTIGLSAGIALCPDDGSDADALLRQADAAMYLTKQYKSEGLWWRAHAAADAQGPAVPALDPYGAQARTLLAGAQLHLEVVEWDFVESFYANLNQNPDMQALLAVLDAGELAELKKRQRAHVRLLLHPETTEELVRSTGAALGVAHALAGVSGAWLAQSQMSYRNLLGERLGRTLMPPRERHRLLAIVEARLQDDLHAQLRASQQAVADYMGILAHTLPPPGTLWIDAMRAEVERLGALPGIVSAACFRLDSGGMFQLEADAGPQSPAIRAIVLDHRYSPAGGDAPVETQTMVVRAWRTETIATLASYRRAYANDEDASWAQAVLGLGVRSAMAFPVLSAAGHTVAVVRLLGARLNQFESDWMRQFAVGLQQRWTSLWLRCRAPALNAVPARVATAYRDRLFSTGGLRMDVQPVVELASGALARVEALARLVMSDGSIVGPGEFLPLLGTAELDRLFRAGLDLALTSLVAWDAAGLAIEVAVNIAPGTLLDPACPHWVEQALRKHRIEARRLTLELLESQDIESQVQDLAIRRLTEIGVRLSMDDFGSGYSSLQRLASLPFDTVKVDQSLLVRIREDPVRTLSLIHSAIQIGKDFERTVVVEGLEDDGMIEAARLLGATYGQGYGLARPMPADTLLPWLASCARISGDGAIRTPLGALAQHWRGLHVAGARAASDDERLREYLRGRGEAAAQALRWQAALVEGREPERHAALLTDWLVGQVRLD
ncbi:MAG: EAL domain-containing protein [Betaproteobacteria bacterium]|nr:EAL domain-containing protein [Betaproteobacteria bacterium]